ncbi:MAG: hypothetical protein ABJQ98_10395 [Alloalcanivorax venustensis]|mgnify:CR=1 FL=1|uniref:hypothetical protein n=1 Tax=Gammaproteobacteria TaxID=1236 RepID=UPI003296FBEC
MTLDDLKKMIEKGELEVEPGEEKIVDQGLIKNNEDQDVEYKIYHGWNIIFSFDCDREWGNDSLQLFEYIEQKNFDEDYLSDVLESIQVEDYHWNWAAKSIACRDDQYEWFYFYADGKPQAACLIYHPESSALEEAEIFYVEYLAVAPWNRSCLVRERLHKGVGSKLLSVALDYSVNILGLKPGFCLHSLPQSVDYYKKIKMINISQKDKPRLLYFEMPSAEAEKILLGVA